MTTEYAQWHNIDHKTFTVNGITFDAPVAIVYRRNGVCCKPHPAEDSNGYIYAMPGGGRIDSMGNVL